MLDAGVARPAAGGPAALRGRPRRRRVDRRRDLGAPGVGGDPARRLERRPVLGRDGGRRGVRVRATSGRAGRDRARARRVRRGGQQRAVVPRHDDERRRRWAAVRSSTPCSRRALYMLLWPAGVHLALVFPTPTPVVARRSLGHVAAVRRRARRLRAARSPSRGSRRRPTSSGSARGRASGRGRRPVPRRCGSCCGRPAYPTRRATRSRGRGSAGPGSGRSPADRSASCCSCCPSCCSGGRCCPTSWIGLIALPLPLGLAVGILLDHLFDIDVVIRRTFVYGGLTLGVVATYVAVASRRSPPSSAASHGFERLAARDRRRRPGRPAAPRRPAARRHPAAVRRAGRAVAGDAPARPAPRPGCRSGARLPGDRGHRRRRAAPAVRGARGGRRRRRGCGRPRVARQRQDAGGRPSRSCTARSTVGSLVLGVRTGERGFRADEMELLDDLARQAGNAIHALRLRDDLARSHERLLLAREEERRRLRRDLHDGLGPSLAAIGMRAEASAEMIATDPDAAKRLLDELGADVQAALGGDPAARRRAAAARARRARAASARSSSRPRASRAGRATRTGHDDHGRRRRRSRCPRCRPPSRSPRIGSPSRR